MRHVLISIGLFLSLASYARADILMFDFNLSFKEVDTATSAAAGKSPPEKVVVIPNIPKAKSGEITVVRDKLDANHELLEKLRAKGNGKPLPQDEKRYNELKGEYRVLKARIAALVKPYLPLVDGKEGSLADVFRDAVKRGSFDKVIISGHSGDGDFFGHIGSIQKGQFEKMFEDPVYREKTSEIGQLFLWGCFTNTVRETLIHLRNFPGAGFIAGFSGRAPTEHRQGNHDYLRASILRADAIMAAYKSGDAASLRKVAEMVRSIPSFSAMSAAITVCGKSFVSNEKDSPSSIAEIRKTCQSDTGKARIRELQKTYCNRIKKYLNPLKMSAEIDEFEQKNDCLCNPELKCTDKVLNAGPPPSEPAPPSTGGTIISSGEDSTPEGGAPPTSGGEPVITLEIDPEFASPPPPGDSSEITKFYTQLQQLGHCDGTFLEGLFSEKPEIIKTTLYLRFWSNVYANWFPKYGAGLPADIGLHAGLSRAEVLLKLANSLKTHGRNPAVRDALVTLQTLSERSGQLDSKMIH